MDILSGLKDVAPLLILIGGILLIIGIVDGGLEIKEARIPKIARGVRILSVVIGLSLIGITIFVEREEKDEIQEGDRKSGMKVDAASPGYRIEPFETNHVFYRVCYVETDDKLNVREKPGVCLGGEPHAIVGKIPYDGRNIKYLRQRSLIGESYWYYVRYESIVGWLNQYYLCPNDGPCTCRE